MTRYLATLTTYNASFRALADNEVAHPPKPAVPPRDELRPTGFSRAVQMGNAFHQLAEQYYREPSAYVRDPFRDLHPGTGRLDPNDARSTLQDGEYIVSQERHFDHYSNRSIVETRIRRPQQMRRVPVPAPLSMRSVFADPGPLNAADFRMEYRYESLPTQERIHYHELRPRQRDDESWRYEMDNCPQPF